jgi:hypothetical protein
MLAPTAAPKSYPGAWIVTNNRKDKSPSDKGRKSIKNGKVYLKDKEEFEIELFNPLQESILCDIKLNGSSISTSGLVLRPGQRFYLDCFIDSKKKFVFNTYEVENTEEAVISIEKNGLLEVYFYKENVVSLPNWTNYTPIYYPYPVYPTYPTYPKTYPYPWNDVWYGTCNNINIGSSGEVIYSSSNSVSNYFSQQLSDNIETGRVEAGGSSSQKFTEVDMQFQSYHISSTVLQILPESKKPVEASEIKVKFCSECGNKVKDKFKFCPSCGNNLN